MNSPSRRGRRVVAECPKLLLVDDRTGHNRVMSDCSVRRAECSRFAMVLAVLSASSFASCRGDQAGDAHTTGGAGPADPGGATHSGGTLATGGTFGSGAATGLGGSIVAGGTVGTGGVASGGLTTSTGGAGATGGLTTSTGGATASTGGATASTGGATASTGGATASTGGATASTGGATAAGSGGDTTTGGTQGDGGASGSSGGTRVAGACQPGSSYPAPILTGTPKLIAKDTSGGNGTYEGPVWLAARSELLFSSISFTPPINPSQMLELTPPSTVATYMADSGTNGAAVDASGVVYACSHKVQGIVKLDLAGATLTTLVDTYNGKHFNSPNDLVIRSDGTIYFTDPDYQLGDRTSETGKKGIYRINPSGAVSVVDETFNEPNGITLSPDESVLYVADYAGNAVRSFAVDADGSTTARKDFASVGSPDGFGMDCLGNLYVASGSPGTVEIYSPSGAELGSVTVAASTSNLAFGGSDGKTLYITAGKALYSLEMNLPGYYE
jgi:gluconolactonase